MFESDERDLIVKLATSSASLATAPGDRDNWVERAGTGGRGGELPSYVRKIARSLMKSGKTKSQAIAIAISQIKRWARGGEDVKADTRAKAVKALAEWETLKLRNKANKVVGLSSPEGEGKYFAVARTEYSIQSVERAWMALCMHAEDLMSQATGDERSELAVTPYIVEMWSTFIIVEMRREPQAPALLKIPYAVYGTEVKFGEPVEVEKAYVRVTDELSENESVLLSRLLGDVTSEEA